MRFPVRRFLLFLAAFGLAATQVEAEPEVIDDKALLRSFEAQVGTLHKESVGLSAPELRRILRTEPKTDLALEEVANRDPLTRPELYRKAKAATLFVGHLYLCNDCDRFHGSAAGGVIVSPDGLALTNFHVLDFARARAYGAMTADGKAYAVGEVLAASRKHDVALIRLQEAQNLPTLPLADKAEVGESIHLVSHPDSHYFTFSSGMVSRYFLQPKTKTPRLQVTAPFARGSSGCGIVNDSGQIVGLVTSTNSIYYTQKDNRQENLQMVVNTCVSLQSIRALRKTE